MLEPDCLEAFVAVVEEQHFVAAADRLGCTQSVVSKRLMRLEDQLGGRLLHRGQRSRITLTPEGQAFLPLARRLLDDLRATERQGKQILQGETRPLRLGFVFSAMMTGLMQRLVSYLRHALPGVEIMAEAMETPEQLVAIGNGRIDLGFIRPRPSYPEGAIAHPIHREPVLLAVSRDSPLARNTALNCAELHASRFIIPQFHEQVGLMAVIEAIAQIGGFPQPGVIPTADFITSIGLAGAGMGVAPVPASLAAVRLPEIAYLSILDYSAELDLVLVESSTLRPAIKVAVRNWREQALCLPRPDPSVYC
ncbi:LysR family transcriptional regulator [Novosphingobium sp. SL115]|uniref:LysR family transcriptional regulator n=1 Tax=Novosphingobium sp. SL115 TaxID=2995150 RepID=UPI002276FFA2|nr:LysR family transcriptional regulator [Novosphingobium sp. SL115]MCY1672061.1 LysR family transcriptional regulator [Novosphingobium sp. SL115]